MKRKIIIGSLLAAFILMLLPTTNAVQLNTSLKGITTIRDLDDIRNMDLEELMNYILEFVKECQWIPDEVIQQLEELEEEEIIFEEINEIPDDNQTLRERIWLRIFQYRIFRLYISLCIFAWTQSKLTLMRTLTWGIKVLRWVKIGILIGVVDPTPEEPPETPEIIFMQDSENNTLTVVSVDRDDVLWEDIDQIGSGNCDPLPDGNVTAGDVIINCIGIIVLRYKPTNEVIGIFEFE
jgi:hypothetical protein